MDSTLISEYIDKTIIDLNKYYPELLFGLDISTLKNQYINNYSSFEEFKVSFDLTVKNSISKFLNKQLDEKSKKNASFDNKIDQLTINISKKIVGEVGNLDLNIDPYKIKSGYSIDECKSVVFDFFKSINPSDEIFLNEVKNILINKVEVQEGRSYFDGEKIGWNYNGSLDAVVTLAHEVSHQLAKKNETIGIFKEVESLITEKLFLNYLYDNKIKCVNDNGVNRELNKDDLNYMLSASMFYGVFHSKRVIEENEFKNLYYANQEIVDSKLLDSYSKSSDLSNIIGDSYKIKEIARHYFYNKKRDDSNKFDYADYNLEHKFKPNNGEQLDNEIRFIYGNIVSNYFSDVYKDDKNIYLQYLNNPMKYAGMLKEIVVKNSEQLVDGYINNYKKMNNKTNGDDLDYLQKTLEETHPDLYRKCSKEEFDKTINEIKNKKLDDKIFKLEVMKLLSKVGDPHTTIDIESNPNIFKYKFIGDKLYILDDYVNSDSKYVNKEITSINGIPINQWISNLSQYVSYDNSACLKKNIYDLLNNASFMEEVSGSKELIFTCADENEQLSFDFSNEAKKPVIKQEKLLDCEIIDDNTMYIKYGTCNENIDGSIRDFVTNTSFEIQEKNPQNVIVDLRGNSGGNSMWFKSILNSLSNVENKTTIVDENTFSSGVMAMSDMKNVGSKVVGEDVALTQNNFGNCRKDVLPNSGISLWSSTSEFVNFNDRLIKITKEEKVDDNNVKVNFFENEQRVVPKDLLTKRENFKIDETITPSINEYKSVKDPVLEHVKSEVMSKSMTNESESLEKKKEKDKVKKLVKVSQNNNSSGFVDTLILCLIVGFVMGVVAALAYMFIVNQ